jgi:hypothetical protein
VVNPQIFLSHFFCDRAQTFQEKEVIDESAPRPMRTTAGLVAYATLKAFVSLYQPVTLPTSDAARLLRLACKRLRQETRDEEPWSLLWKSTWNLSANHRTDITQLPEMEVVAMLLWNITTLQRCIYGSHRVCSDRPSYS